jgi:uncharacterized lipoprotein YajG
MKHVSKSQGKRRSKLDGPRASVESSVNITIPVTHSRNVRFTLEDATKAQRGSRGIAILFI